MTCSLDRTIVLFDVSADRQCLRRSLPEGGESITSNPLGDMVCVGGSSGSIYLVDMSATADALSAVHKKDYETKQLAAGVDTLEGHSRRVGSLAFSADNCTMVSGSDDGSVRVWDTWTRQCIREFKPLSKCAVTSVTVRDS